MVNFDHLKGKLSNQFSSFKNISLNSLVKLSKYNPTSEKTVKQLVKFEKLSIFFRASRYGFNQNVSNRSSKTDYFGLIARVISQINLIRLIVLVFIDDEDYQLYLGDVAYKTKHRIMMNILLSISFLVRVFASEWFVSFDKSGKYSVLSIYSTIIEHGFKPTVLQMSPNIATKFHLRIHLLTNQFNRSFIFSCLFLSIAYFTILLSNANFYQVIQFTFYSLVWSIATMISTCFLTGQNVGTFGYLILIQMYHLCRLRSVVELVDSYRREKCTDEIATRLIKQTFSLLNQAELCSRYTRSIVLYGFTVIALIGDLVIFYGFIIRFHSPLFANVAGAMGCFVFTIIGGISLIARAYIIEASIHTIQYNQLI